MAGRKGCCRPGLEPGEGALKASGQMAKRQAESHHGHKSRGAETGKPQVAGQACPVSPAVPRPPWASGRAGWDGGQ